MSPTPASALQSFSDLSLPKKVFVLVALAMVLFFGGRWIYNRFLKSEEDHIRDAIAEAVEGMQGRSPSQVTGILAENFKGPHSIDKNIAHQAMIVLLMQTYRVVEVRLAPRPIPVVLDPGGKSATASFSVSARGKQEEQAPWEDLTDRYNQGTVFKTFFRKDEQKGWRIETLEIEGRGE